MTTVNHSPTDPTTGSNTTKKLSSDVSILIVLAGMVGCAIALLAFGGYI